MFLVNISRARRSILCFGRSNYYVSCSFCSTRLLLAPGIIYWIIWRATHKLPFFICRSIASRGSPPGNFCVCVYNYYSQARNLFCFTKWSAAGLRCNYILFGPLSVICEMNSSERGWFSERLIIPLIVNFILRLIVSLGDNFLFYRRFIRQ